MLDKVKTIGQS